MRKDRGLICFLPRVFSKIRSFRRKKTSTRERKRNSLGTSPSLIPSSFPLLSLLSFSPLAAFITSDCFALETVKPLSRSRRKSGRYNMKLEKSLGSIRGFVCTLRTRFPLFPFEENCAEAVALLLIRRRPNKFYPLRQLPVDFFDIQFDPVCFINTFSTIVQ